MKNSFVMNGIHWDVRFVSPNHETLVDRRGVTTVATTDPITKTVYVSNMLHGELLQRVFLHELGHCAMVSYDLLDEIHRVVDPKYWIYMEEWICNFIADYGRSIFQTAYQIFGEDAWSYMISEIGRFVA